MSRMLEVVICLLAVLLLAGRGGAALMSNSGGGNWQLHKEITIKENSGINLTDYQVLLQLSGGNFPTSARSDGADIRFADSGEKELNYWIESWDLRQQKCKHMGKSARN